MSLTKTPPRHIRVCRVSSGYDVGYPVSTESLPIAVSVRGEGRAPQKKTGCELVHVQAVKRGGGAAQKEKTHTKRYKHSQQQDTIQRQRNRTLRKRKQRTRHGTNVHTQKYTRSLAKSCLPRLRHRPTSATPSAGPVPFVSRSGLPVLAAAGVAFPLASFRESAGSTQLRGFHRGKGRYAQAGLRL